MEPSSELTTENRRVRRSRLWPGEVEKLKTENGQRLTQDCRRCPLRNPASAKPSHSMPADWVHWHETCPLEGRALTNTKEATKCTQNARNSPKLTRHYARTSLSRRSPAPAGQRRNGGVRGLFLEHNGYAEITIHFPTRWTCPDWRTLAFFWAPATI